MRSQAREIVFKFIFSQLFNKNSEELFAFLKKEVNLNKEDSEFADALLSAINNGYDKYLKIIEEISIGYKLDRIFNADKCAILIGIAELDNFRDIPKIVVIDEAVKLASKYSTEKSTDFVNGILAQYERNYLNT